MNVSLSLFHEIVEIKVEEESVVRARAFTCDYYCSALNRLHLSRTCQLLTKNCFLGKKKKKKHIEQMILNPILSRARFALAVANTINTR